MKSINEYIDENRVDILNLLEKIVNMDSASDNKKGVDALGSFLGDKFAEMGLSVEKNPQVSYGDHVICRLGGSGDNTLLIGHMDTALPEGSASLRPFTIIGDKGYGPGVADMKSGLVAMLFAVKAVLHSTNLRPNITIIINSDEEPGSPTSCHVIWREAPMSSRVFVLEGGRFDSIVTRRKGVGIFTFRCKGVAAHAGAEPEKGRSAIVEMGHRILEINALNDPGREVTVNVGSIQGGTYPYVVAEEAAAKVDCRIPTREDGDRILQAFNGILKKVHVADVVTEWEGSFHRQAMEKSEASHALYGLVRDIGLKMGLNLGEVSNGGASDANLTSAMGIPTLCGMGPQGYGYHGLDEYVEIETIFERTKLLAQVLCHPRSD